MDADGLGLMTNAWAIWRLLRPAATSANTSTSRRVRPSGSVGVGAPAAGADAATGTLRSWPIRPTAWRPAESTAGE
jgi:hypothetical protein